MKRLLLIAAVFILPTVSQGASKRELLALASGVAVAEWDAAETRHVFKTVPGTYEADPMQRPFARGPALYFTAPVDVLISWTVATHLRKHGKLHKAAWAWFGAAATDHVVGSAQAIRLQGKYDQFIREGMKK